MTDPAPPVLDDPVPGRPVEVLPAVARLTAPNPSVMTGLGTNTYLVGARDLVVVDPGPDDAGHIRAVAAEAAARGRICAVVVTHTHEDHSPGAASLARLSGAPVLGYSARDGFVPTAVIGDGDVIELGDLPIDVVHTPGHASNHLCYLASTAGQRVLFSGDHIMGGSTVVIAPPDGDMREYLASLEATARLEPAVSVIAPGHGPLLPEPAAVIEGYVAHRLAREAAVLAALCDQQEASIEEIVSDVYTDVPMALHPIARYSVWAHLLKLADEGLATSKAPDDPDARWAAASGAARA